METMQTITLDESFDGRQFNGVDNSNTTKSLSHEHIQHGTCQYIYIVLYKQHQQPNLCF